MIRCPVRIPPLKPASSASPPDLDTLTLGAALLTVLFWASAFAGINVGLKAYSPVELALLRYLVASVAFGILGVIYRIRVPKLRDLPIFGVLGILGVSGYHTALSYGQQTVSAGAASLLIASAPIFTVLWAVVFLKERLRLWGWLGIGLSFTGIALIVWGEGQILRFEPAALIVLLAAVMVSGYVTLQKPLLRHYSPLEVTAYAAWIGTLMLGIFLPSLWNALPQASLDSTLAIVYLGICPTAISYTTWGFVLSRLPASITVSFLYLSPPLAIVIAWLWLGEIPTLLSILGGLLALAGVIVVNLKGRSL